MSTIVSGYVKSGIESVVSVGISSGISIGVSSGIVTSMASSGMVVDVVPVGTSIIGET